MHTYRVLLHDNPETRITELHSVTRGGSKHAGPCLSSNERIHLQLLSPRLWHMREALLHSIRYNLSDVVQI